MSLYGRVGFGQIEVARNSFYKTTIELKNPLLSREILYQFDADALGDYDILSIGAQLDQQIRAIPAQKISLPAKYHLRPDVLCFDIYGDPDYYFMVNFVNRFESWESYISGNIILLPEKSHVDAFLLNVKFATRQKEELAAREAALRLRGV